MLWSNGPRTPWRTGQSLRAFMKWAILNGNTGPAPGISKAAAASVRFMGSISNEELPPVLNRYRFFALPSVREGMPKALIEAMACGLVCIGTDVEGINEIIRDGENGFLAGGA